MKFSLLLVSTLLCLGPASYGPGQNGAVTPQGSELLSGFADNAAVGLLLSTDAVSPDNELDGTFTTYKASWDLTTGIIQCDADPTLVTTGPDRASNLLSWDGKDRYLVWDAACVSGDPSAEILPCREAFQDGTRTIWGPDYRLSLTPTGGCTVTQDGMEAVTVENLYRSLNNAAVDLTQMSFLGCERTGDTLTLVYSCFDDPLEDDCFLLHAALDLQERTVTWSAPARITGAQGQGILFAPSCYPVLNQKLYFSAGDTIAYYDLVKNTVIEWKTLPDQIKALLPGAEPTVYEENPSAASAGVMGCTNDVVLASFDYRVGTASHTIYLAVRDGQVLGLLDWQRERSSITTYGADWKALCQIDLPAKDAAVLTMPTVVSPRPF